MDNKNVLAGGAAILVFICSLSIPYYAYSQENMTQAKGLKAFAGEAEKVNTQEVKVVKTPQGSSGPGNYDAISTEIEMLKKANDELRKEIDALSADRPARRSPSREDRYREKNKELEARLKETAARSKEESSDLYLEMGNAYTKAKLYKDAIDAYLAALKANPKNAEAHYNLGLLYERYQGDSSRASYHFKQYLNSNPPPDRKKEVQYFLNMLRSGREWVTAYY